MSTVEFLEQLDERIAKYDLLRHPFYEAWSAGELSRKDLVEYGQDYFHHVRAFPSYLEQFASRPLDAETRRMVRANILDENGGEEGSPGKQCSHAELWLDFVEGMGGKREQDGYPAIPEILSLMRHFFRLAREGSPHEVLAAFYAYESQIPGIAEAKARGLREKYGADHKTCEYFRVHITADAHHAQRWRQLLERRVTADPGTAGSALDAAEAAACLLWHVLDGIEARRQSGA